ncbi:hypothetical protein BDZ97DRAFT_1761211 [Flammula alnicola]|nr:hypothetical protein BDZ97DRAFT_1761211 [Flammula alnicola]
MSGRNARNPFTSREDEHLVKYIATYNPKPEGRQGNNLYKTLEENTGGEQMAMVSLPYMAVLAREIQEESRRIRYKDSKISEGQRLSGQTANDVAGSSKAGRVDDETQKKKRQQTTATINREEGRADGATVSKSAKHPTRRVEGSSDSNLVQKAPRVEGAEQSAGPSRPDRVEDTVVNKQPKQTSKPSNGSHYAGEATDHAKASKSTKSSTNTVESRTETIQAKQKTKTVALPASIPPIKTLIVETTKNHEEEERVADSQEESQKAGEVGEDDYVRELFGSDVENEDEDIDQVDELLSSSPAHSSPPPEQIYPNLGSVRIPAMDEEEPRVPGAFDVASKAKSRPTVHLSQEPTPPRSGTENPAQKTAESTSTSRVQSSQPKKIKPKLRKIQDDDPFETPPPSPPPLRQLTTTKVRPPILVEGPFRNTLKRARPTTGDDDGQPGRLNAPGKKEKLLELAFATMRPKEGLRAEQLPSKMNGTIRSHPPEHVNAVASSSKEVSTSKLRRQPEALRNGTGRNAAATLTRMEPPVTKDVPAAFPTPLLPISRTTSSIACQQEPLPTATLSWLDAIDLHRESLHRRLNNASISVSSNKGSVHSSSVSASGSKNRKLPRVSNILQQLFTGLGLPDGGEKFAMVAVQEMAQAVTMLADAHGVAQRIALDTYANTGSLENTKFVLQEIHDAMSAREKEVFAKNPNLRNCTTGNIRREWAESWPEHDKRHSNSQKRNGRPSLTVKPLPVEEDDVPSDYTPPNGSRAGQFARLVKQGRIEEAVEREKRRVSGVFVPQTQEQRRPPLSPADISPTPHSQPRDVHMEVDAQDDDVAEDDDIYMPDEHEKEQEADESENQPEDESADIQSSPPYPSTRTLLKRLSGGRENDPVILAQAQEHRNLALNVDAENDRELRIFETKHNPDLLRLWSLKWVNEIMAAYQPEQLELEAGDAGLGEDEDDV